MTNEKLSVIIGIESEGYKMNKLEVAFTIEEIADNLDNNNIGETKRNLYNVAELLKFASQPVVAKKPKKEDSLDKILERLDAIERSINHTSSQISEQNMHWDMYTM